MPRAFKRPAKTLWWVVVVVVVVRTPTPNYLRQASPDRGKKYVLIYGSCKVRFLQTISKSRETSSSLDEDRRRVGQHSALVVARAAAEHAEEARRLRGGLALALGPAREVEAHLGKYHATCGPE